MYIYQNQKTGELYGDYKTAVLLADRDNDVRSVYVREDGHFESAEEVKVVFGATHYLPGDKEITFFRRIGSMWASVKAKVIVRGPQKRPRLSLEIQTDYMELGHYSALPEKAVPIGGGK